jgi:acyl dehydratase
VNVGDQPSPLVFGPLSRQQLARYAGASGDFNPMHTDEAFAQKAGMPSVFGHGLLGAGVLARLVERWLGGADVTSYSARFVGQVWPGDVLTCTGRADAVEAGVATCSFTVTNQDGATVLTARATARTE